MFGRTKREKKQREVKTKYAKSVEMLNKWHEDGIINYDEYIEYMERCAYRYDITKI